MVKNNKIKFEFFYENFFVVWGEHYFGMG